MNMYHRGMTDAAKRQTPLAPPVPPAPPETVTVDSDLVFSLFGDDPGYEEDGWVKVAEQGGDSRRWQKHMILVLRRVEDGKLFGVGYELGLTEYQDHTFPWNDSTTVELREIEARQVTRTVYGYRRG